MPARKQMIDRQIDCKRERYFAANQAPRRVIQTEAVLEFRGEPNACHGKWRRDSSEDARSGFDARRQATNIRLVRTDPSMNADS